MPQPTDDMNRTTDTIVAFLARIGLCAKEGPIPNQTFLPGISVAEGVLVLDRQRLLYPGDLLHEAGHLAVISPAARRTASDDFGDDGGNEMAAIAWSYAACVHLGLPLTVLFHDDGYKGDAAWLAETFASGRYIGLPLLEWKGMTTSSGDTAFPAMRHWLCP